MVRLTILVLVVLALALLCVVRPGLPLSLLAHLWRLFARGMDPSGESEPGWVTFYVRRLPADSRPDEVASMEEWVRVVGMAFLALPLFLLLAVLVLSP